MSSLPESAYPADRSPSSAGIIHLRLLLKGQPLKALRFDQGVLTVGRHPGCDVCVDNPGVSRHHLTIERSASGECRVMDQGSANGTYLNDQPVKAATLRSGDVIRFGKFSLEVEIVEAQGASPPAAPARVARPGDGATVVLSPDEVRQIVARTRAAEAAGGEAEPVSRPPLSLAPPPKRTPARSGLIIASYVAVALLFVLFATIMWWRTH